MSHSNQKITSLSFIFVLLATFALAWLLTRIFEHKQESQQKLFLMAKVDEQSTDPLPWSINFPYQYDTYKQSVDQTESEHGGSSALPADKLEMYPWLKRLFAGYAFSIDYRELRGHAFMLYDQENTKRINEKPQSGACLHCHSSPLAMYRKLGLEASQQEVNEQSLGSSFNWEMVKKGFEISCKMNYAEAHTELLKTPDGTPDTSDKKFPGGELKKYAGKDLPKDDLHKMGNAHPVSCIDCHDPKTMKLRITRPGLIMGLQRLAKSADPLPHLPSIEKWRQGNKKQAYDANLLASRQEMRSLTCAQCHVEYYCASKETLFFPWDEGLGAEQIEATYEKHKFPDGSDFIDYKHAETGAVSYKAQHPEFELWSQGIHARSGVSCADCHMPYEKQGATKVSNHWVSSPKLNLNHACQTCHNNSEQELNSRIDMIQERTKSLMKSAAEAMTDMLDSIVEAKNSGVSDTELRPVLELQRKAMWRLDFICSENSYGFHADQEAARLLGESINYSRKAQQEVLELRLKKLTKK